MKTPAHMLVGALAAALPDVALAAYGWRREWLPETHPLVRAHQFLHSPAGIVVPVTLGWISHLIADRYSTHRTQPGDRA
jgi:hypothetical protein